MTPLEIEVAIWYYTRAEGGFPNRCDSVIRFEERLICAGLLDDNLTPDLQGLGLYLDALCSVPLPVKEWVMPLRKEDQ